MQITGRIHSFQSMGAVDGPGLRFVVFMQGCPLRCAYCHNPDTWDFQGGQAYTPEQVAARVMRCLPYLKGGGVTVSGGEPLAQPRFVKALFRQLKQKGVHTALDTSGAGDLDAAREVLADTDLVLADVKFLSGADYRRYCGADFDRIAAFLELTRQCGVALWVRQVVVPGLNDTPESIDALAAFLKDYPNLEKIELLGFEKLCLEKYDAMGIAFPLRDTPAMDPAALARLSARLPQLGH
jgi:pyruvate formate lyase activating enzyme